MALQTLPPLEVADMQHEAWLKAMDEVGAVLCLVSHLCRFMSRGKWQLSADTTHAALSFSHFPPSLSPPTRPSLCPLK